MKGQKRSVLHADGPQGRAINLWESRRSKAFDVKLRKQHFTHTHIRGSRSQFSTCGVRLLSTNQQLSLELPSLQDEPKIELQRIKVSVSITPVSSEGPLLLCWPSGMIVLINEQNNVTNMVPQ